MATNNSANQNQLLSSTSSPTFANVVLTTGGQLRSGTTNADTLKIAVYDVDGAAYTDVFTFTAGNTPTANINYLLTLDAGINLDMAAGNHTIGASIGANNLTLGGASSTVIVAGNLTVSGTTTAVNTTNLNVADKNILVNKGGNTAGTTGAGLDFEGDAAAVVGYIKVGAADNSIFELKTPGNAGILTLDINATKTITIAGALNIEADSNINQDLTTDANVLFANINLASGGALRTATANGSKVLLQGYDVDGTAYVDFVTITAGNIPTFVLEDGVTAITQTTGNNTTKVATTAFVQDAITSASAPTVEVTGTSQAMVAGTEYIANNAALVTLTLPTTAALGTKFMVCGKGAGGWKLAQNASQIIHFNDVDTTSGTGGYLASTGRYHMVQVKCITENTDFEVIESQGNLTYV